MKHTHGVQEKGFFRMQTSPRLRVASRATRADTFCAAGLHEDVLTVDGVASCRHLALHCGCHEQTLGGSSGNAGALEVLTGKLRAWQPGCGLGL